MSAALNGTAPLPSPDNTWTPDLLSFLSADGDDASAGGGGGGDAGAPASADPLCLTPPMASGVGSLCVSPFELEKRPKPFSSAPAASGCAAVDDDDIHLIDIDGLPLLKDSECTAFIETLLSV